jgi:hypothetical protein
MGVSEGLSDTKRGIGKPLTEPVVSCAAHPHSAAPFQAPESGGGKAFDRFRDPLDGSAAACAPPVTEATDGTSMDRRDLHRFWQGPVNDV